MHFTQKTGSSSKSVGDLWGFGGKRNNRNSGLGIQHDSTPPGGTSRRLTAHTPPNDIQLATLRKNSVTGLLASPRSPLINDNDQIKEDPDDGFLSTQKTGTLKRIHTFEPADERVTEEAAPPGLFDEDDAYSMEDGRMTKLEYQKLQIMDMSTTLVAVVGAILTVMIYDIDFEQKDDNLAKILLWVLFGTTWVAILLNLIRYLQKIKFFKARNTISSKDNLFSTGDIWYFLLETFILLLQPYPFIREIKYADDSSFINVDSYYYVNEILSLLIVGRSYLLVRCALNNVIYKSPRAYRVGDMYGSDTTYMYAVRCIMKVSPFEVVTVALGLSIVIFGYMLRICERPLNRDPDVSIEFNSYWNAMWCVILTMTTVGYGDVYARTMLGRSVSFIMCMWGISIVSVMVVTLTNVLALDAAEEKSLVVVRRLELKKVQTKSAAFVLTNIAKLGVIKKRYKNPEKQAEVRKDTIKDIKHHLQKFKTTSRKIKGLDGNTGAVEEVNRQISNLREDVRTLMETQAEFQAAVLQALGKEVPKSKLTSYVMDTSKHQLQDFDEDVVISKTR